ncbi:hypothetical protein K5D33_07505 [Pseudomonas cichorii]|nr:hypothetical protein [Pseudomonas cichorii]MBX8534570.1 hypothetical protein [Pseudomonas cichorii]
MTRNEHDEIESYALAALIGLLSRNAPFTPAAVAVDAFEIANAFHEEKLKRIGEKPPFDC